MSFPEDANSDSASGSSEDASSVDGLWQPDQLCQETDSMSVAESDVRRSARRRLLMACAVSLVFMTGEVIGKMEKNVVITDFSLPQVYQILYE